MKMSHLIPLFVICSTVSAAFQVAHSAIEESPGDTSGRSRPVGVPRIDPNYNIEVDQWWASAVRNPAFSMIVPVSGISNVASHPFNPESPKYEPQIKSPVPVLKLTAGQSIQEAINKLPRQGGTIKLAPGVYGGFRIVARSNIHIISDGGAVIKGSCRIAVTPEAMDYGNYDRMASRGQRDTRVWELHKHPTRNFYFKNLTFSILESRLSIRAPRFYEYRVSSIEHQVGFST